MTIALTAALVIAVLLLAFGCWYLGRDVQDLRDRVAEDEARIDALQVICQNLADCTESLTRSLNKLVGGGR